MDVVVQRVRTTWTKASRGGTAAALRNAAPTAFPLPPDDIRPAPAGQWLRWQVNYRLIATYGGQWHYRLDTFNIAYEAVTPGVFLGTPTRTADERGFVL